MKRVRQMLLGTRKARFDGSFGDAEHGGCLMLAIAFDDAQEKHLLVMQRQLTKRRHGLHVVVDWIGVRGRIGKTIECGPIASR